jgi:hypothetical protein
LKWSILEFVLIFCWLSYLSNQPDGHCFGFTKILLSVGQAHWRAAGKKSGMVE